MVLDARPVPTYLPGEPLDPLLELRQNPRLLRSVVTEVATIRKKLGRLPRVLRDHENDEPRIVTVADAYLQATGSEWHAARDQDLYRPRCSNTMHWSWMSYGPWLPVLKFLLLEEVIMQANGVIQEPASHTEADAELLKTRMRSLRDIGYADWFTPDRAVGDLRSRFCSRIPPMLTRQWTSTAGRLTASGWRRLPATPIAPRRKWRRLRSPWPWNRGRNTGWRIPRLRARRAHVGYYIIDRGFPLLAVAGRLSPALHRPPAR